MKIWIEVYKDVEYPSFYITVNKKPGRLRESFDFLGEIGRECFYKLIFDARDIYDYLTLDCTPIETSNLSSLYELEI
jgi:hypothetical protein